MFFYNKNSLEMDLEKLHWKWFYDNNLVKMILQQKYIENNFLWKYNENDITIKTYCKLFYYKIQWKWL